MLTRRNRSRTVMERRERASRRLLLIFGLIGVALLLMSLFFDERGLPTYLGMRQRAEHLQTEIRDLEKGNAGLRQDISRVDRDPARIEELARDRLGLVRKGEVVYQVVEEGAPGGAARK